MGTAAPNPRSPRHCRHSDSARKCRPGRPRGPLVPSFNMRCIRTCSSVASMACLLDHEVRRRCCCLRDDTRTTWASSGTLYRKSCHHEAMVSLEGLPEDLEVPGSIDGCDAGGADDSAPMPGLSISSDRLPVSSTVRPQCSCLHCRVSRPATRVPALVPSAAPRAFSWETVWEVGKSRFTSVDSNLKKPLFRLRNGLPYSFAGTVRR